ncbi:MAG TPA: hypothetical protein VFG35_18735 [Actinoplanes sp.]|nr:hypothetical protein [Actinoplanes sp.]
MSQSTVLFLPPHEKHGGRTTAPEVLVLGHEITGEVIDGGPDVEFVNAQAIPLDAAPRGYQDFDQGAAKKYVLDPHGLVPNRTA